MVNKEFKKETLATLEVMIANADKGPSGFWVDDYEGCGNPQRLFHGSGEYTCTVQRLRIAYRGKHRQIRNGRVCPVPESAGSEAFA